MSLSFVPEPFAPAKKQRAFPNLNRGSQPGRRNANSKDAAGLSVRQAAFVDAYFGPAAGQPAIASRLVTKGEDPSRLFMSNPDVLQAIAVRGARHAHGAKVEPADIIANLLRIGDKAEEAGQYAPAIRAQELVGKHIAMFVEHHVNYNVDATKQHIEALKAKMLQRKPLKLVGRASTVPDPFDGL